MNYSHFAASRPAFTFRYKLWDKTNNCWDDNREFSRKLKAANTVDEFILFPKLHVESFSSQKGLGDIQWSFAANTKDIVNFIHNNLDNQEKVRIFTPKRGERRQVVSVSVETFAKEFSVLEIDCQT